MRVMSVVHPTIVDLSGARFYSGVVDVTNKTIDGDLERLELRIDALTGLCDRLYKENHSLLQRMETLTTERASLLQKNDQARGRVEAMIGRLKTLESNV